MKKFDIVVFDGVKRREDHGVMAESPAALASIYAMTDEKIVEVLREYEDEDCKKYGKFDPQEILSKMDTPMAKGTMAPGSGMMRISDDMQKLIDGSVSAMPSAPSPQPQASTNVPRGTIPPVPGSFDGLIPASRPNPSVRPVQPSGNVVFFKVGNVECKMENGVVYQKKWSPATETDMRSIRVVLDKTGKELSMAGKHVELLKWEVANEEPEPELGIDGGEGQFDVQN